MAIATLTPGCQELAVSDAVSQTDDLPQNEMRVRVLRGPDQLRQHIGAWQRLAETALEPNVFYEPCMLLPALESLASDCDIEFVVVEAQSRKHPHAAPIWCGLFPIENKRSRHGLFTYRQLWRHIHCFLCTPLVRSEVASEALEAFLAWHLADARGRRLLKLASIGGDGPVHRLLIDLCHRQEIHSWTAARHSRAILKTADNAEAFLLTALPRKRRHEFRRHSRRLTEQGQVEFACLQATDDVDSWINEFLGLEASGWKGKSGTALSCSTSGREFFRAMAHRAFDRGQLLMTSLRLDGKPIAHKCSLLTGDGGFAFKIAFDQQFAKFSPGALLEMHNIETLHELPGVEWMDSCANPDHPMINQLWPDRRVIESLWVAGSSPLSHATLALMPFVKWLRSRVKRSSCNKSTTTIPTETPSP